MPYYLNFIFIINSSSNSIVLCIISHPLWFIILIKQTVLFTTFLFQEKKPQQINYLFWTDFYSIFYNLFKRFHLQYPLL